MNYKVLYRKYRPDGFDSLVGQKHIVEILKNSVKEGKIAHAYLFSGPRGTGKTSTARILARAVNCLNNKDGVACGECSACLSFNGNPDIIEIDAASNNGVDEIRELINNVKIMPTSLQYKVYIIDEVHMLSASAFNALLLTLEEPPKHVIFILATTNLESVPITIVSRCQRFEFHRITDSDILDRLKYICEEEKIDYEEDGLKEIANLADGGLRDALSMLDQLSKNNEAITSSLVSKEIGSISNKRLQELIKALDNNDIDGIEEIFKELEDVNLSYKVFVKKMIYLLSKLGAKLLVEPDGWRLSFDDCKRLVMELNDMLMKVSISVSPYLVLKMIFLSYVKGSLKSSKVEETTEKRLDNLKQEDNVTINEIVENKENFKNENAEESRSNLGEMDEQKNKNGTYQQEKESLILKENLNVDNRLIDIRINNTFVEASKAEKSLMIDKWNSFVSELSDQRLKGMLQDTSIAVASKSYVTIMGLIPHLDEELNNELERVEELFNSYINETRKIIFISEDKWKIESEKYARDFKAGKTYKYMNEKGENPVENELDISQVADIFDIEKIEVE